MKGKTMKFQKTRVVKEEIALDTPCSLNDLLEAIAEVTLSVGAENLNPHDVQVVGQTPSGRIILTYKYDTAGSVGLASDAALVVRAPLDEPATKEEAPAVVPPFPTSPDTWPLPELTPKAADNLVFNYEGTFYFRLPENYFEDKKLRAAVRTRPRTAALKLKRQTGQEVLVSAKVVMNSDQYKVLRVTVVR